MSTDPLPMPDLPPPPPSRAAIAVLVGPGLRDVMARRVAQIDQGGFTPDDDAQQHPGWMVAGALEELRRAHGELDGPRLLRAEPGYDPRDSARGYLIDAIVLAWAALDRIDGQPRTTLNDREAHA